MSEPGGSEGMMVYWTEGGVAGLRLFDGEAWGWEVSKALTKKEKNTGFLQPEPKITSVITRGEYVFIALSIGKLVCLDVISGGEVWSRDTPALQGEPIPANKVRRPGKVDEDDDFGGGIALGMLGLGAMAATNRS